MTRLTVVQPYVPRYRSEFYRRSAAALADVGVEMTVLVGRRDSTRADGDPSLPVTHRPDRLEGRTKERLRYRSLRDLGGRDDLLLLEQAIKNLDGYPALLRQRTGGPSVGFWGHGRSYSSTQPALLASVKQWMTRRGQWFFAYTDSGAVDVTSHGFPADRVTVLNNSLDTDVLSADIAAISDGQVAAWSRARGLNPARTALFLGGLDAKKSTDYVLAVARQARALDPTFTMLIAGSGPDEAALRQAQSNGAPIHVVGRVDGVEKAMVLRASQVLAIPSQLGLIVIDAFVAGRPIITRRDHLHGPEAEYLRPGRDSIWLPSDEPAQGFAQTLIDLLDDSPRLSAMQNECAAQAPHYSIEAMVGAFVGGVVSWRNLVRTSRAPQVVR